MLFIVGVLYPVILAGQGLALLPGSEYVHRLKERSGGSGVAAFPAVYDGSRIVEILDPTGFHVHMSNVVGPGDEIVYPAGELFVPQAGRFRMFLQGEWSMTPFSDLAGFSSAAGMRIFTLPVVPAGRVSLATKFKGEGDTELRLLYAGGDRTAGHLRHELTRRRRVSQLGKGILMPEGQVFAALWDRRQQRYIALSRPFTVHARRTTVAPLESPAPTLADLVVYVDRTDDTLTSSLIGMVMTVKQQEGEREADLTVPTAWGVYAIWYGLREGSAVLRGANNKLYLEPHTLKLTGGEIVRYQGRLSKQLFVEN